MRVSARLIAASILFVTALAPSLVPSAARAGVPAPTTPPTPTTPWAAYRVTDLGPLPGGASPVATAINNAGVVAGYSNYLTDAGYLSRAVLWKNGVVTDLGLLPGGSTSRANAINDAGQVAGQANRPFGYVYPVRWSAGGVIQDLGGTEEQRLGDGRGIDPSGRVVGGQKPADRSSDDLFGTWYGVDGTMTELGTPPSSLGVANGVNARDQIVGGLPAYLWQNGSATTLPVTDTYSDNARAFAINARGQIAGSADVVGTAQSHPVLWSGGTLTDLGTLDDIPYSSALAINASGQVVGTADRGCSPCSPPRAWTWQPGKALTPLDSLVAPGSGWTFQQANGINDAGQIVGAGVHDGVQRAFLLTPAFHANINFQPPGAATPVGYRADTGAVFGRRAGGLVYGWNRDNTANTRDRDSGASPDQRYDTLIHLQKPGGATTWELAVPNGTYLVHLVAGDPGYSDSVFRLRVESVVAVSGTRTATAPWLEGTVRVTVTDGRLTVSNAPGSSNDKIDYLDVVSSP